MLWEDIIVQFERVLRFRKRYLKPGGGREIREARGWYTDPFLLAVRQKGGRVRRCF